MTTYAPNVDSQTSDGSVLYVLLHDLIVPSTMDHFLNLKLEINSP